MSTISPEERLLLEQKKLGEMRRRITEETCLKVMEVAGHFGVSRSVVEGWPYEVLPYMNTRPGAGKCLRRYHPADVIAAAARLRGWERALRQGEGDAFLRQLRQEIETRDREAMQLADEMARQVWRGAA